MVEIITDDFCMKFTLVMHMIPSYKLAKTGEEYNALSMKIMYS